MKNFSIYCLEHFYHVQIVPAPKLDQKYLYLEEGFPVFKIIKFLIKNINDYSTFNMDLLVRP